MATSSSGEVLLEEYCQLVAREDSSDPVELPDGEKVVLNGGEPTGILRNGNSSSNHQVELCLNLSNRELRVVCTRGDDPACVAGGTALRRGEQTILGPGAILELLPHKTTYMVFFGKRVVASSSDKTVQPVKRQFEQESGSKNRAKRSNKQTTLGKFFFGSSPSLTCKWRSTGTLQVMTCGDQTPSTLIASFDLDGTLTSTKSGRLPFRAPPDDWKFWHACVPKKLRSIRGAGYRLVIFTNQGGMNYGNPPLDEFKVKIQAIVECIGNVPLILIAATDEDNCRKPLTGMWEYFVQFENQGAGDVDLAQSYFIGDAAGRVTNWNKKGCKKDFSCCDRKFAANIGLPFHTPEEFFLGEPPSQDFTWEGFNPFALDYTLDGPSVDPPSSSIVASAQEIVLFVGCPASGKTTFYRTHMSGHYRHINRDKLGTWERCVAETERVLRSGLSAVIDNTNPDIISRSRYIELARTVAKDTSTLKVRCFLFLTPPPQCIHNNRFRELTTRDADYKVVSEVAFHHYNSRYQEPTVDEGFDEIVKITLNMKFTNPRLEQTYKKFYK